MYVDDIHTKIICYFRECLYMKTPYVSLETEYYKKIYYDNVFYLIKS